MDGGGAFGLSAMVLRKTYGSFPQILKKLPDRIRLGLGVVDVRKLKNIQEDFFRLEQQLSIRKVLGTTAGKISQQFQECFPKVELSVYCLEPFYASRSAGEGSVPRPRSIMWKGLRFILSHSIWFQTGVVSNEDVEDSQVQSMVQWQFGRGCLKRLVGRVPVQVSGVPGQCHNCGLSWSIHELDYPEVPPWRSQAHGVWHAWSKSENESKRSMLSLHGG